jgi:hypothetical protein
MRYADGRIVRIGDTVCLKAKSLGVVVCSIDTVEYSADFPQSRYNYLEKGIFIEFSNKEVIYVEDYIEGLVLVGRNNEFLKEVSEKYE